MLIVGPAQVCRDYRAVNKGNPELVGDGVYCSPHYTFCLFDYTVPCTMAGQTYRVVLQCRVKPEALKCATLTHWVINSPKDIRPYGIVLFT
jgi:hypothetical protein